MIIKELTSKLENKCGMLEEWLAEQYKRTSPLFYTSVDLRHSGYKIAPVDTNLFPAGFNLLTQTQRVAAIESISRYIKKWHGDIKKVVIVPENHTRNTYYLHNVFILQNLIISAGYSCKIGGLEISETIELTTSGNEILKIEPIKTLLAKAELIVLNNDLTSGIPEVLKGLDVPITPPMEMGWYQRRKSRHFEAYQNITENFAKEFGIDQWQIAPIFSSCGKVDFRDKTGLECVALNVEKVLHRARTKFEEYGIKSDPYVFIKADNGTYGMGIMTAHSGDEVLEINKKARHKMDVIKEGVQNSEVIIQEGIPTIDKVDGQPAEPLFYLTGGEVVGCTYRVNNQRDEFGNLNSAGMSFVSACAADSESSNISDEGKCTVRGIIARLAALAASRECYEVDWNI